MCCSLWLNEYVLRQFIYCWNNFILYVFPHFSYRGWPITTAQIVWRWAMANVIFADWPLESKRVQELTNFCVQDNCHSTNCQKGHSLDQCDSDRQGKWHPQCFVWWNTSMGVWEESLSLGWFRKLFSDTVRCHNPRRLKFRCCWKFNPIFSSAWIWELLADV